MTENPFVLRGYVADKYFCDREQETVDLRNELRNGNNVTLIAPRRIGKTGLLLHLFHQEEIQRDYHTFLIDIYSTKNLEEMIQLMGKSILMTLKPNGRKAMEHFVNSLQSLRPYITFDVTGNPTWGVEVGNIQTPLATLDEIFSYLETADKPSIVAIDEFQTINSYSEQNVEALLRTHIQHCHHANFVFSGSHRTLMSEMFLSTARPFYQSTSIKSIKPIPLEKYTDFAQRLFKEYDKHIDAEAVAEVYRRFEGITWYVQRLMNKLFSMTERRSTAGVDMIETALADIIDESSFAYQSLLFQLPPKQKELVVAINKEGKVASPHSSAFVRRYGLSSASSVQGALKGLMEKDFITQGEDGYELYDKFFALWLNRM